MADKIDYHKSVNYSQADPMKVLAQNEGKATAKNMPDGFSEIEGTRGESAYLFKMPSGYGAFVQEGLGTKSLIAQAIYKENGESYFEAVAQDTVACIINDLVSVGARPVVLNAYWSSSSYEWLTDEKLAGDLIKGWRKACDEAEVALGGGETQSLSNVIEDGVLELAGSAFGYIDDEAKIIRGKNLQAGDAIVFIESSGVHANGISLIREIAKNLPEGYSTDIGDGRSLGEAVLAPTPLYSKLIQAVQSAGVPIHYASNITGHGWRKIMRSETSHGYEIKELAPKNVLFDFIAKKSGNDIRDMYGNYNMGAGYALYVPSESAKKTVEVAKAAGYEAWIAGKVTDGPKQVKIQPLDITFSEESLEVR